MGLKYLAWKTEGAEALRKEIHRKIKMRTLGGADWVKKKHRKSK